MAVVVQVAMASEAQPFLDRASEVSHPHAVGRAEHRGVVVDGHTIALVTSGIGTINAADATLGARARYGDDTVIVSAGTAGGLAPEVALGEVIVGSSYVHLAADARAFGYALGQVPGMPATFDAHGELRAACERAARARPDTGWRSGRLGSADRFVTAADADAIRADFPDVIAVDMESAAIAHVAHNHAIGFVSVRAVSDLCAPGPDQFEAHLDDAAERSALAVIAALPALAERC